uniref:S-acyltransferase n=1 Tax=Kalanchoe fedtschenkoi TaxID=63787 RepID=A0A7N0RI42_KALFE
MARTCSFSLPVAVVVSVICYIYTTTILVFLDRWLGLVTSPGIINAFLFTSLAMLCVYTYAIAIFTDPGTVPATFTPDVEDKDNLVQEIKRKGGDLRYCQKCLQYKPPRAHHCRVCKRCVLRMDHHCIWINNCVGHSNYKFFFVFVLYAVVTCLYSLVLLIGSLTVESPTPNEASENGSWLRTTYVISGLLTVGLLVALSLLLSWHITLILQNKTTIEYHEGVRALWLAEKGGEVYNHPYDLGAEENLALILGPSVLTWVWPTSKYIGSGLRFPTVYENQGAASSRR